MRITVNNDTSYYDINYIDKTVNFPPEDKIRSTLDKIRTDPSLKDDEYVIGDFGKYELRKGYIPLNYPMINTVLLGSSKLISTGESSKEFELAKPLYSLLSMQYEMTLKEFTGLLDYSYALIEIGNKLECRSINNIEKIDFARDNAFNNVYLGARALEVLFERLNLNEARLELFNAFLFRKQGKELLKYIEKDEEVPEGFVNLVNRIYIRDIDELYMGLRDASSSFNKKFGSIILTMYQNSAKYGTSINGLRAMIADEKSLTFALNITKERLKRLILKKVPVVPIGMIATHPDFNSNPLIMLYKNIIELVPSLEQINSDKLLSELMLFRSRRNSVAGVQHEINKLFFSEFVEGSKNYFDKAKGLIELLNHKGGIIRREVLGKKDSNMARHVISPAPDLPFNKIRIPIEAAKKIFDIHLVSRGYDLNNPKAVREGLREIIKEVPVCFNRQPTLHRLSIQGFWASLNKDPDDPNVEMPVEVTDGYNADFDGDQMVISVPILPEAVSEVKNNLLANYNILKPRDGSISTIIKHETVYGIYMATKDICGYEPKDVSLDQNRLNDLDYITKVINNGYVIWDKLQYQGKKVNVGQAITHNIIWQYVIETGVKNPNLDTMVSKILEEPLTGSQLKKILNMIFQDFDTDFYSKAETYHNVLLKLAKVGYRAAALCPPSVDLDYDRTVIESLKRNKDKEAKYFSLYEKGLITEDQFLKVSLDDEIYSKKNDALYSEMLERDDKEYGILNLIKSGAKCSRVNFDLLYGVKGPIAIEGMGTLKINNNYLNGLDPVEHCMSSMGTMPSMMLKTLEPANTGYNMRSMQHITSDTVIRSYDCGTTTKTLISMRNIKIIFGLKSETALIDTFARMVFGRHDGTKYIDYMESRRIAKEAYNKYINYIEGNGTDEGIYEIRTLADCKDHFCSKCYGKMTTTWENASVGQRIGSIASPAIGEIGTQATMKEFQKGGKSTKNKKQENIKSILSQNAKHKYDSAETNAFVLFEGVASIRDGLVYIGERATRLNPARIVEGRYYRKNSLAYDEGFITVDMLDILDLEAQVDYMTMIIMSFFVSSDLSMKHIECLVQALSGYKIVNNPMEHPRFRVGKLLFKQDYENALKEGIVIDVIPGLFKMNTFIKNYNTPLLPLAFERIKEAIQGFLYVDEVKLDSSYGRRLMGRGPGR